MRRVSVLLPAAVYAVVACTAIVPDHPPKPQLRNELIPLPPAADAAVTWQPGHYDWTGTGYRWAAGEWVSSAGHGILWQDGAWQGVGRGSVWVAAHWI